jgi:hypothetical protein
MNKIASEKQKNDALKLGLAAHEDGLSCIPAHDKKLMDLIKELSGQIGASKPLLESWIRGWHKAHSLPNRAAAQVTADDYKKEAARYLWFIVRGNGKIDTGFEYNSDAKDYLKEVKEYDKEAKLLNRTKVDPAKLTEFYKGCGVPQRMLDKGYRDAKKDAKMANGYVEKIMGNYVLAGDLLQLSKHPNYKYKSEEFQKSDEEIVLKLQKMLHKEHLSGCHDDASCDISFAAENDLWYWAIEQFIGSGAASSSFKNLYKQLSPEFKKEAEAERKIMAEKPHKECRHCHSVNWGDDVEQCGQCLNKISASFFDLISAAYEGEVEEDPTCNYPGWANRKTCKHIIEVGKHPAAASIIIASRSLSAEDAAAGLLSRYFEKRAESIVGNLTITAAPTDLEIQKMDRQVLLDKIRSKELTYDQVDKALEKIKKFNVLDWLGDKLADDELKNNKYEFVVDADERDTFSCHVDDPNGKEVWSASTNDDEDGEFSPVVDGFMKHTKDIKGLEEYLKDLKVIPKDATVVKGN